MSRLSARVTGLPVSPIVTISKLAGELRAKGCEVYDLAMGNPSYPISSAAKKAMTEVIERGDSAPYGSPFGIDSLRREVATRASAFHGAEFGVENVVATAGAAFAYAASQMLVLENPDQLSLLIAPTYPSYLSATHAVGGASVFVRGEKDKNFKPSAAAIRTAFADAKASGKEIRSVTLNYPNNPSGSILNEAEAREIAEVLNEELERSESGFLLILDDAYQDIIFEEKSCSPYPFLSEKLRASTVILGSGSKTSGLANFRVGHVIAEPELAKKIAMVQSALVLSTSNVAQEGLAADLRNTTPELDAKKREYYHQKSQYVSYRLNEIADKAGWSTPPVSFTPEGSIFVFADFSSMIGKRIPDEIAEKLKENYVDGQEFFIENDQDIASYFIAYGATIDAGGQKRSGVATVPGSGFSIDPKEGFLRFSISGSVGETIAEDKKLHRAMDSIEEAAFFLEKMQRPKAEIRVEEVRQAKLQQSAIMSKL